MDARFRGHDAKRPWSITLIGRRSAIFRAIVSAFASWFIAEERETGEEGGDGAANR
jgi:hypothetical protein